jgi:chaperonin cofactor prefoldin
MTDPVDTGTTALPGAPDAGGLSPEEVEFFRTGDTTALPASYAPEAPAVQAPAQAPAPAVAAPAPAAPPVAAPAPQQDFVRLLENQQQQFQRQLADVQAKLEAALKPAPEPEPDPYTDPIGNQMYKLDKLAREMEQLRTGLTQQQQQADQTRTLNEFVSAVKADKDTFAASTPDFPKAYEHIRAIRTEDLRQAGCSRGRHP